jgi:hypothetical protein
MTSAIPTTNGAAPNSRLNGWKEIAAHFGRSVRTVQRWEKAFGMPVYRIGTGRGENVHASSAELDAWLATAARSRDLRDQPGDAEAPENGANGRPTGEPPPVELATSVPGAPTAPRRGPSQRALAFAALVTVVAVVVALVVVFRQRRGPPDSFQIDHDTLHVVDRDNRVVFSRTFPFLLPRREAFDVADEQGKGLLIWDLDGDGSRETVLFAPGQNSPALTELICLDHRGNQRFRKNLEGRTVRYGDVEYRAPWTGNRLFVTESGGKPTLWATWHEDTTGQFPCLLQRLAPDGSVVSEYWSAGYINSVTAVVVGGIPSIVVGAANNDQHGGSLAVFPEGGVTGSAPAIDPAKRCHTCGDGGPVAFLIFPGQAELRTRAGLGGEPQVLTVRVDTSGRVRVIVNHLLEDASHRVFRGAIGYNLAPDLTPLHAEFVADFVASHNRFAALKLLDHLFDERDLPAAWPVLVYKDGTFVPVTGTSSR